MADAITNPYALASAIIAAKTRRVPVMYYADSTGYTNGGDDQGFGLALRNFGPFFASSVLASGQAGNVQYCLPAINGGTNDFFTAYGINVASVSAQSGAPAAQEAIFKSYSSILYQYGSSGLTGTPNAGATFKAFAALNARDAIRAHIWDVTFSSGSGNHKWLLRLAGSPYSTLTSTQTFNTNTGTVARRHSYFDASADPARSITTGIELRSNPDSSMVGPWLITGLCFESPNVTNGYMSSMGVSTGGHTCGENLDELLLARQSHRERWLQNRDVVGSNGPAIAAISYGFNDRNSTEASHQYSGLIVGSASSTTFVIDDTSGVTFDGTYTVTKTVAGTLVRETKTVSGYDPLTKTVTVASSWTTAPAAGDVWRISLTTALENTGLGYYYNIKKMKAVVAADAALAGFSAVFVVIPAWRDTAAGDTHLDAYETYAATFANEDPDVTAVGTNTLFPFSRLQALPYGGTTGDTVHIGGYAQAALISGIWQETLNAYISAQQASVAAAASSISAGTTLLGTTGTAVLTPADVATGIADAIAGGQTFPATDTNGNPLATSAKQDTLQTAINNLNNLSALANLYGPSLVEIPDAGTVQYPFSLTVKDTEGHLVDLDASPTVTVTNAAGTDRSGNLSAITHESLGVYTFTYGATAGATDEGLRMVATGTVSASARHAELAFSVVNYDTVTTLNDIQARVTATQAKANLIGTNAADSPNVIAMQTAVGNLPTTVGAQVERTGGLLDTVSKFAAAIKTAIQSR